MKNTTKILGIVCIGLFSSTAYLPHANATTFSSGGSSGESYGTADSEYVCSSDVSGSGGGSGVTDVKCNEIADSACPPSDMGPNIECYKCTLKVNGKEYTYPKQPANGQEKGKAYKTKANAKARAKAYGCGIKDAIVIDPVSSISGFSAPVQAQ